jgi:dienelactone hydrolase
VLTNGIRMADGSTATADRDYATIKTTLGATVNPANCATLPNAPMQGACGFTASHFAVAANPALGAGAVNPANVIVSFHFSTQATRDTMRALGLMIFNPAAPAPAIAVNPAFSVPLNALNPALPPIANARVGTVTVPYYSYIPTAQAPGGISTDSNLLRRAWTAAAAPPAPLTDPNNERNLTRFNPVPALVANKAIPMLVTVPNANAGAAGVKPANGWPVVIFQHGITGDRTNALAIAGAFAQAGWVVVAVDLPLHGVASTASPLYQASNEQHFNLDLVVNASGAAGQDTIIDPSGTHYINLTYPLASRDNLRQAAVNMLALTRALPGLDLDADPNTVDVDPTRIAFTGMSLGSITGIVYGSVLPNPTLTRTMAFSVPGGGIAELLRDSVSFGPRINAGLQTQGLLPNTSLYNQFMRDVQAIIDSGDPLNYVVSTATQRRIYFSQVIGGTTPPPLPDQVIPNSATQRLITAVQGAGITFPRVVQGSPVVGSGYVNFIAGDHGSLLSPAASGATTVEMQTEVVTFTATGNPPAGPSSPTINVANGTVVQP